MDTEIIGPPREKPSVSTLVNGHGPAMQERRALRNSFPSPESRNADPIEAFHCPSGEQGGWSPQGMLPRLGTSNVLTPLPILTAVLVAMEYRTRTFEISISRPS